VHTTAQSGAARVAHLSSYQRPALGGTFAAHRAVVNFRRTILAGGVIVLLFACDPDDPSYEHRDDLTAAVVSCEEAYARLEGCCPGFDANTGYDKRRSLCRDLEWLEAHKGCDGKWYRDDMGETEPLALVESECIRDRACDELVSSGVCERAWKDVTTEATAKTSRNALRGICP